MEFKNLDFNSDKQKQYEEVRMILSKSYNYEFFGVSKNKNEAGLTKSEQDSINLVIKEE